MWIKYTEYQATTRSHSSLMLSKEFGSRTGFDFRSTVSEDFSFRVAVTTGRKWNLIGFGRSVIKTNWNQFTLTVDDNIGVCAFINGVKDACQTTYQSVSLTDYANTAIRLGGTWFSGSEPDIYIDDFAVWQVALTENEVRNLYEQTKN